MIVAVSCKGFYAKRNQRVSSNDWLACAPRVTQHEAAGHRAMLRTLPTRRSQRPTASAVGLRDAHRAGHARAVVGAVPVRVLVVG
jgi:hypothetical protein